MPCLGCHTLGVIAPRKWAWLHVRVEFSLFEVTKIVIVQVRIQNKLWTREEAHHIPVSKAQQNMPKFCETKHSDSKNSVLGQVDLCASALQFARETPQHEAELSSRCRTEDKLCFLDLCNE
jgi:hypothetical protein